MRGRLFSAFKPARGRRNLLRRTNRLAETTSRGQRADRAEARTNGDSLLDGLRATIVAGWTDGEIEELLTEDVLQGAE